MLIMISLSIQYTKEAIKTKASAALIPKNKQLIYKIFFSSLIHLEWLY